MDHTPSPHPSIAIRWRWWVAYCLFVVFLLLPGPDRSLFAGMPLPGRAQVIFLLTLVAGVFSLLFPPHRTLRFRWLTLLALAIGLKAVLMLPVIPAGWSGTYWNVARWFAVESRLTRVDHVSLGGIRHDRVDREIAFDEKTFALYFVNDLALSEEAEWIHEPRDFAYPFRARWQGYVWTKSALPTLPKLTAKGMVSIAVDGMTVFTATNPKEAAIPAHRLAAPGQHVITVDYVKPAKSEPGITLAGIADPVTPRPATPLQFTRSVWAARGITLLGLSAVALMIFTAGEAYARLSSVALEEVWLSPMKVAAVALFAVFLMYGFKQAWPYRHLTVELSHGDDYLGYEAQSRQIVFNGILMVDREGHGHEYYWYPLYPYGLAAAHLLFGEDFATIILFNFLCIGTCGIFFWLMLRNRLAEGAGVAAIVALGVFLRLLAAPYCMNAFTDNLYLPMVLATLTACTFAFERRSAAWMTLAGILTALTAATRPSGLIFVPFFFLAIILDRHLGGFFRRVCAAITFAFGFFAGVSPFTLRNWIVARKFVLLVSSFVTLPYYLYVDHEEPVPTMMQANGHWPGLTDSIRMFFQIWATRPTHTAWVEIRKLLFTLGITDLGSSPMSRPRPLILVTVVFGLALWRRVIPWPNRPVLVAFALSHLTAMVMAAPWTYGYKSILPLHVAFLLGIAFLLPGRKTVERLDLASVDASPP
jgi:hypothetical protein